MCQRNPRIIAYGLMSAVMAMTPTLMFSQCDDPGSSFTDSVSQVILPGTSTACDNAGITADNRYYRNFDLAANGITDVTNIVGIQIGIELADPGPGFVTQPVNINLYYDNDNDPAPVAALTPITTLESSVPLIELDLVCFPIDAMVDPLVSPFLTVEIAIPDAFNQGLPHMFLIGGNSQGQESESYIATVACGFPEPVPFAAIGFPDLHVVMNVFYQDGPPLPQFIRGDVDGSGVFNALVDALFLLAFGFQGGPTPPCLEAADVDGGGDVNALVDTLYLLAFGFQGGPPPLAPYPKCGDDPDLANSLGCNPNACP